MWSVGWRRASSQLQIPIGTGTIGRSIPCASHNFVFTPRVCPLSILWRFRCAAVTERAQSGKKRQIQRQVRGEAPILAGVTETAASDIETANFSGNRSHEEDDDERG